MYQWVYNQTFRCTNGFVASFSMHLRVSNCTFDALENSQPHFRCTWGFPTPLSMHLRVSNHTFRCTWGFPTTISDAPSHFQLQLSMHLGVSVRIFRCTNALPITCFDALKGFRPGFSMHLGVLNHSFRCTGRCPVHWLLLLRQTWGKGGRVIINKVETIDSNLDFPNLSQCIGLLPVHWSFLFKKWRFIFFLKIKKKLNLSKFYIKDRCTGSSPVHWTFFGDLTCFSMPSTLWQTSSSKFSQDFGINFPLKGWWLRPSHGTVIVQGQVWGTFEVWRSTCQETLLTMGSKDVQDGAWRYDFGEGAILIWSFSNKVMFFE